MLFHNVISPNVLYDDFRSKNMWDSIYYVRDQILRRAVCFNLHTTFAFYIFNSKVSQRQLEFEAQLVFPVAFCFQNYSKSVPCCVRIRGYPGHLTEIHSAAAVVQIKFNLYACLSGRLLTLPFFQLSMAVSYWAQGLMRLSAWMVARTSQ